MRAKSFLRKVREELEPLNREILNHPYILDAERGVLPVERVKDFVAQQYYIVSHDVRSIAMMVSRAERPGEQEFFKKLLEGDMAGLRNLLSMAGELGLGEEELRMWPPKPGAVAYTHYLAWLSLYANPGEQAFALIVNLPVWGSNCGRLARALRERYGMRRLEFLEAFASIPSGFEEEALRVVEPYLGENMRRIARLIQAYEKMFWDSVYQG